MIISAAASLKLTPVPYLTKKLDLDQEAQLITVAFNDVKELILDGKVGSTVLDATTAIHSLAVKRLHSTIERWNLVEDRLQNAMSSSDQVPFYHS